MNIPEAIYKACVKIKQDNLSEYIEWAAEAGRHLDNLSFAEKESMKAVYVDKIDTKNGKSWASHYADEGLNKWYQSLDDETILKGADIACKVL
jgi:hypothetical protein